MTNPNQPPPGGPKQPPPPGGPYYLPPPGQYPPPGGPYYGRPPKKRHRVRNSILGSLAAIVLIIIIVSVANGGGGNSPSNASGVSAAKSGPSALARPPADLGSAVRDGKFQFTVTSVSQAKTVGDTGFGGGTTAQGEYTVLHVTVSNISGQAQTLDDSAQYVYDSTGRKYNASSDADIALSTANASSDVIFNNINLGNTVSGLIAFDMPSGDQAVKAELHDSPFSLGVTVSLGAKK